MSNTAHGTFSLVIQPGGLDQNCDSQGKVWTAVVRAGTTEWGTGPDRGDTPTSLGIEDYVPTGVYLDTYSAKTLIAADGSVTGMVEATLVFREPQNMQDGIVTDTPPPPVYECDWQMEQIALAGFTVNSFGGRYSYFGLNVTAGKTLWGYTQDYENAVSVEDQKRIFDYVSGELGPTSDAFKQWQDYLWWKANGVEAVETYLPVLIRTQTSNSAPTVTDTPGQLETPPSAFGDLIPPSYSWRRMPDRSTRTGRIGPYTTVSRWVGNLKWNTQFYGTQAQQASDWKAFT